MSRATKSNKKEKRAAWGRMGRKEGRRKQEKGRKGEEEGQKEIYSLPYSDYFGVFKYILSHLILAPTLRVKDIIST